MGQHEATPAAWLYPILDAPGVNWVALLALIALGLWGLCSLQPSAQMQPIGRVGLFSLGIIGIWRWGWSCLHILRGRFYQHVLFPVWRRRAHRIPLADLPPVCILVPTYKEQPWITERVFRALAQEAQTLAHPITLLVTSSGEAENAAVRSVLEAADPGLRSIRLIQQVQTGEGKRKAMAIGLRALAQLHLPPDTVVALMDGDSEITPGTLRRCLPFFRMFPRMGALTTDELPIVHGSYWFSEWFHLRLAQRHYQMCSLSLSRKVSCLTGRFSLFRAEAALAASFSDQLECDTLTDWLWGKFKFLSGDDKSTWFWLLCRGYDMLYIPDVIVYSIETIHGSLLDRTYQNMRRWYGNMLRNSGRAIGLAPWRTGLFLWLCLVDQRISIWTALLTPGALLLSLVGQEWQFLLLTLSWIAVSRPLYLMVVFAGRSSHLKLLHVPMLIASLWSASVVKIWTQMNLAQQKWSNRGNQSISANGTGVKRVVKVGTSRFLYLAQVFSFGVALLWLTGMLNPVQDVMALWQRPAAPRAEPALVVSAIAQGIIPNDGQDDAAALQALIARLPRQQPVQIDLPIGQLDLAAPIAIRRSHIRLQGGGIDRTILQANFSPPAGSAAVVVRGSRTALQRVTLSGFTLRYAATAQAGHGLQLQHAEHATLSHLQVEAGMAPAIVLRETRDVAMSSVTATPELPAASERAAQPDRRSRPVL